MKQVIKWLAVSMVSFIAILLIGLIVLMVMMYFSLIRFDIHSPWKKPYSKWQSEDGRVVIYSAEDGTCYGTIKTGEAEKNMFFNCGHRYDVEGYDETGEIIEEWTKLESKKGTFLCEVTSLTEAFNVGELIRIDLVEKNIKPDEMPAMPKKPFFVYKQDPLAPNTVPLSVWQTEDGRVTVYVAKNGTCYGTIKTEKEEIKVFYHLAEEYDFDIYRADNGLIIEHWGKNEETKNRLLCQVVRSQLYKEEEMITLNLIQKDLREEELPPMPKEPEEVH